MYLTRVARYALKLSLNYNNGGQITRRTVGDRGTVGSAVILAAIGLSMSIFSLKQMLSSKVSHAKMGRIQ